jgi:hypothetical protein
LVLAPAPIMGMLLREIMPDEEAAMLALIERAKKKLDGAQVAERQRAPSKSSPEKYEPTAIVDRPRAGRARQISITAVDEPPVVGTKLGAMVMDMPGESVPLSRTAFESLRRTNKKLFYSLIGLSGVAVLLLVAVAVAMATRPDAEPAPSESAWNSYGEDQEPAAPGVVSRARPGAAQTKSANVDEELDRAFAERAEREEHNAEVKARKKARAERSAPPEQPHPQEKVEKVEAPVEPPPPPKREAKAPYPELRAWLAQLRSSGKDTVIYYKLLGGIETAMSSLPPSSQKRIQAELGAATLTYDVDAVERALRELMKAHANPP